MDAQPKTNMPRQLLRSWGHNNMPIPLSHIPCLALFHGCQAILYHVMPAATRPYHIQCQAHQEFYGRQIVGGTFVSLVILTCGSWSESQHDPYFTVQWPIFHGPVILPYILKTVLFGVWTSYFGIMCQYDLMFDLKYL